MTEEDRRPSVGASIITECLEERISTVEDSISHLVEDIVHFNNSAKPLIIREVSEYPVKKTDDFVIGKCKCILNLPAYNTPSLKNSNIDLNQKSNDVEASSSNVKVFVNKFSCSNAISDLWPEINANYQNFINNSSHYIDEHPFDLSSDLPAKNFKQAVIGEKVSCEVMAKNSDYRATNNVPNAWKKTQHIKLNYDLSSTPVTDDGIAVIMNPDLENVNSHVLRNSLVIIVLGSNIPFPVCSRELRKQWSRFGKFHLTTLGLDWILCSFTNPDAVEEVLEEGPWFIRGNIIGLDRWSPTFSPESLKGLTAPIWIRMPCLPLHCWDEQNICRIASMIGAPLYLDGNYFKWGKRGYARDGCLEKNNSSSTLITTEGKGCLRTQVNPNGLLANSGIPYHKSDLIIQTEKKNLEVEKVDLNSISNSTDLVAEEVINMDIPEDIENNNIFSLLQHVNEEGNVMNSKAMSLITNEERQHELNKIIHGGNEDSCYFLAANALDFAFGSFRNNPVWDNREANQHFVLGSKAWLPPPPGWIKCNVDASLSSNNLVGIGGMFKIGCLMPKFCKAHVSRGLRPGESFRRFVSGPVHAGSIFEKYPTKIKNYGIWLRYQSRTGYHNMYKEYRDTTLNGAVEHMYNEMASRHRVRFPCIQIIKTATIPLKLCKREITKQFHDSKIKFPLVFKKVRPPSRKLKTTFKASRPNLFM
ncbi:hypothetical protein KFK09_020405 [Dendrobium nobile]|uniref:60S ribosomal protein L18a n=1 Tax=Dendrobium nobile TaxID=94219 RepID=A0A8T3ALP5_DENNO|nr:hypothetical protein KFK09_020405 [Dendrobium nobile]